MLDAARSIASQIDDSLVIYACDLVEADILWDDDRARALAALRRGLERSRSRGYYNTCLSQASMMARLAVCALDNDIEPEYVRALIARRRLTPVSVPAHVEAWPWRYRLRALGSFAVVIDDERKTSPSRSRIGAVQGMPLRLLQALLALGGRGVRDTELADALWPDAEGDTARRVFDTTLHRLRRQLGEKDVVQLREGRVYIDDRLCWVDLWALESTLREIESQLARGAPGAILSALARKLIGIYRGPLLADSRRDDPWILRPRARIAAKVRRVADELRKAIEDAGQYADAKALSSVASASSHVAGVTTTP